MARNRPPFWIAIAVAVIALAVLFFLNGCGTDQKPNPTLRDSSLSDTSLPPQAAMEAMAVTPSVDTTIRWDTVNYGDTLKQAERTVIITSTTQERDSIIVVWRQPPLVAGISVGAYFDQTILATGAIPAPMNIGVGGTSPDRIVGEIALAKQKKQKRAFFLPDGSHCPVLTPVCLNNKPTPGREKFDIAKWKSRIRVFATPAIKAAIAQGVSDGTITALYVIDEPSNGDWGGVFASSTLAGAHGRGVRLLDEMARYADSLFPGVPTTVVGIAHLFKSDSLPTFKYLDAVASQYDWWQGSASRIVGLGAATLTHVQQVRRWRDTMTAISKRKGVQSLFQINVLAGSVKNSSGTCPVPLTGGPSPLAGLCRLSAAQLRDWGRELLTGCAFVLWKQDAMLQKTEYRASLNDLVTIANSRPRTSCSRQ